MKASWFTFLIPPQFPNYEQTQKAVLLHYMLLAGFIAGLLIGLFNLLNCWYNETVFLFLFAGICALGFHLNRTRHFKLVAFIYCASLYFLICLMLYNGVGLYDETLLVFPVFIIGITFLLGRRGIWTATFLSIIAVIGIHLLQVNGMFTSKYPASLLRVTIISLLLLASALVIWVVHDSWEKNIQRLRESYDLTLQGWARALEYKDGEVADHTRRVTELTIQLAQKLGLSPEEIQDMKRGAYLHDIGKMAIPDRILQKPGPLTDDEWEVMKQHPVLAREFISEIPFLEPAIQVAYWHHERWDGSGYPEGLRGDQIPLAARIFAVIDNWDALNSDRPYRKAWLREKVIVYLRDNAGTIFDPKVVKAFLNILNE
jgi:putative nucleotidyltransferase with HDIG domain